jgi:DNA-binding GntR family transcriptional regulator
LRTVVEGLAAQRAARHAPERAARQGPALIRAGRQATANASVPRLVAADRRFHEFVYELSGNPLLASTMAVHWTTTERVMSEVLQRDETPMDIWDQHAAILDAIAAGDADRAEALARAHTETAASFMTARLRAQAAGA